MSDTKWTQRMALHLNGGSEFSQLNYEVCADGEPTGVMRITRTSGSPQYLKTVDEFHYGDQVFDVLKTKGVGLFEWLDAVLANKEAPIASA